MDINNFIGVPYEQGACQWGEDKKADCFGIVVLISKLYFKRDLGVKEWGLTEPGKRGEILNRELMRGTYKQVQKPEAGDIVVFYPRGKVISPDHVGIMFNDKIVIHSHELTNCSTADSLREIIPTYNKVECYRWLS